MKCLQSLYLSDPQDDLAAIRSAKGDRVPGTCEWILAQDRYTKWLVEQGSRLLWLSGGPGIGKTMVSSFLVEEMTHLAERSSQMTLAYYFCDDKDEKRRTATAILRGLLLQLLRQRPVLFKHIQPGYDMSRDTLFTNFHSLWRVFLSVVYDPEADNVYCLIDALDECGKESRQPFLTSLTTVFGLQQEKKTSVKFIITSRRENDIEEELVSADNPYVQDLHIDSGNVNHDLFNFINVRVNQLAVKRKFRSKRTAEELERVLTQKAGGTFLYVSLVLNELRRTPESQMQRKLQEWPSELNGIYDKILSQIEDGCEDIVKMVLRWIVVARRPLKIREIATACVLSSEDSTDNTISSDDLDRHEDDFVWCRSFVFVDKLKRTVNLVHQSAKDYLLGAYLQANERLSQFHIVLDKTNLLIFRLCWMYLGLEEFKQGTVIIKRDINDRLFEDPLRRSFLHRHCFLKYANEEWRNHALAAGPALASDHAFWKEILNKMPTVRDFWLLKAAREGQRPIVQQLLEEGAELNSQDVHARTSLSWAAERGYTSIVKLLLSRDGVLADFRDVLDRTPLSFGAGEGHETIVTMLVNQGAVVDAQDYRGRLPLHYAVKGGHEAVINLLLRQDDVAVHFRDDNGRTPLYYATEQRYETIVTLLLNRGAVVDSQDYRGRTPLHYAVKGGHKVMVRLLLNREAIVDSRDKAGRTPLFYAAGYGREAVVRLLMNRGADVDSRDDKCRTPLSYAAERGHEATVRLLISRDDIAIDARDNEGRTPLDWAERCGNRAVVRLLEQRLRNPRSSARTGLITIVSDDEELSDDKEVSDDEETSDDDDDSDEEEVLGDEEIPGYESLG